MQKLCIQHEGNVLFGNLVAEFSFLLFFLFFQVACNWEDVKYLKQEMEKPANASTFHTRLKILNAIISMQVGYEAKNKKA